MRNGYLLSLGSEPLLLTPFQNPKGAASWDMDEKFRWRVSETPQAGRLEEAEALVFSQIDRGIDRRIQDEKYFPRLFLSAGAFLVVYFVLSFAVRDPIPMVDELLAGIAAAVGVWILMERKAVQSDASVKIRLELKQRVFEAETTIDPAVGDIEAWLDRFLGAGALEAADALVRTAEADLPPLEGVPEDFTVLLEERLQTTAPRLHALVPRIREARKDQDPNVRLNSRLVEALQTQPREVALLALFVKILEISEQF